MYIYIWGKFYAKYYSKYFKNKSYITYYLAKYVNKLIYSYSFITRKFSYVIIMLKTHINHWINSYAYEIRDMYARSWFQTKRGGEFLNIQDPPTPPVFFAFPLYLSISRPALICLIYHIQQLGTILEGKINFRSQ